MQTVARTLIFKTAEADKGTEMLKDRPLPEGPVVTVICMDGYDHLEAVRRNAVAVVQEEASEPHRRFSDVCARLGLPLAKGKKLVRGTLGPLLGGEVDGSLGLLIHGRDKTAKLVVKT